MAARNSSGRRDGNGAGVNDPELRARAIEHRPKTFEELRLAIQRMRADGFSDHGIAAALGLAVEQVRRLPGKCRDCE